MLEKSLIEIIRWTSLAIWVAWLILYWGAGIGLAANLARSFRSSNFFYDRFFILGLVLLSNVILWTGYFRLRGKVFLPLVGMPWPISVAGGIMVLVGAMGTFWCRRQMRESWSAHTTLVANHRLVDSGLYRVVRHPIYAFASLMALGTVLVFPAWWNFPAGLGMVLLYVIKSRFEEEMLCRELAGYREYCRRVRYRILPCIW